MAEVGGRKKITRTFSKTSFPWFERKSRFMELSIFKQPQCLIFEDESGNLDIKDSVLNEIEVIDVPLSIAAIVGLYRTGKSYLMNQIAHRKSEGFSMGHTVRSHTKGIWVWCIIHPTKERHVLMLIDTEGLADPKKANEESDQKLFCLTVLLSSTLIYNVRGVFNADAIKKISFVSKMSQSIKVCKTLDNQENEKMISLVSPTFILCLRDFYLQMGGEEDNAHVTEEQYLESCLSGFGDDNETIKCIRKYFPNRTCFRISMPVHPRNLTTLDNLTEKELDAEFIKEIQSLREYIYKCKQKRFLSQKEIDGLALAEIVKTYVEAIRNGFDLDIEEAYEKASKKRNEVVVTEITNWFQNRIKEMQLPITRKEELQNQFFDIHSTMMQKYREKAYLCGHESESILIEQLKRDWKELRSRNSNRIQDICREKLDILHDEIIRSEEAYNFEDGYSLFKAHMGYLESNFYSQMNDFDKDELTDAFQRFKDNMNEKKMEILRKEKVMKDIKQKEKMDALLEKRLQEKYESLERDKIAHIEKEKRKLIDTMRAHTEALEGALEEVNKKGCILS
ncbi:guanylate-binding protein 3-like [Ruditapes philippinarum]|uniref:guanylate-binding protein 3-like n=1 Tax=Ruditapes philippinarum TaxID=129788 RepID=UPI00295C1F43|nr:guanylate-binding protein 3-like [Ruditapes philippinarum]